MLIPQELQLSQRNLTVYEIDKAIIYCCWEIGI